MSNAVEDLLLQHTCGQAATSSVLLLPLLTTSLSICGCPTFRDLPQFHFLTTVFFWSSDKLTREPSQRYVLCGCTCVSFAMPCMPVVALHLLVVRALLSIIHWRSPCLSSLEAADTV